MGMNISSPDHFMGTVTDIFERFASPLREKILERRIKLLRAEAHNKRNKVRKHEDKLLRLELEYRRLKDKYKTKH